jgi:hypothetical protein
MAPQWRRSIGGQGVPYVLQELKEHPGYWFWALHFMAGENLGMPDQTQSELRDAWLAWGQKRGYPGL